VTGSKRPLSSPSKLSDDEGDERKPENMAGTLSAVDMDDCDNSLPVFVVRFFPNLHEVKRPLDGAAWHRWRGLHLRFICDRRIMRPFTNLDACLQVKLVKMLGKSAHSECIHWGAEGNSIVVPDTTAFSNVRTRLSVTMLVFCS
jgi:hypothetical protein